MSQLSLKIPTGSAFRVGAASIRIVRSDDHHVEVLIDAPAAIPITRDGLSKTAKRAIRRRAKQAGREARPHDRSEERE